MTEPRLPLPIAALIRRSRNAKSLKDQHDLAYFAWEASVRIAVAASPPVDRSALTLPSMGHWASAVPVDARAFSAPSLLAAHAVITETALGKATRPRSVTRKELLDNLAAYRNQVIGHGSVRAPEFYSVTGPVLLAGVEEGWRAGLFLGGDEALVFVDIVERTGAGRARARLLDLAGLGSTAREVELGEESVLVPGRVYVEKKDEYRCVHPFLLYREVGQIERVLFFNGRARHSSYLDYASGETLKGKALAEAFPGIEGDVSAALAAPSATKDDAVERDPSAFGDYRLLGKIGEGGMGEVFAATQLALDRVVALKLLPEGAADNPVALGRFRREIAALSRCEHPGVVKILASGVEQGRPYYAMELVEGVDLSELARALPGAGDVGKALSTASEKARSTRSGSTGARWSSRRAPTTVPSGTRGVALELAVMFRDAARAVQHLHDMGIVHRDLKPGNLMLTADQRRVVVMDLGLAALGDASRALTRESGAILGTLRYMPPEQLRRDGGAVDPRVDVYALGATFYELLTGRPLFSTDSEAQLLDQVLNRAPVPPRDATPALPRDLCTIVEKCLSKEARARYSSAAALADDLDAFLEGRAIAARAPTLGYVLLLAAKRHRAVTLTAALASLTLVAVLAHFMRQEHTLRHDAVEARHNADEKQIEARDRLGDFLTEQARVELVDRGDAGRALAYLHAARKHGYESPTHAFLLSEALRAVEKDVIPLEGGAARIDKLVFDQKGATLAGATDEGVIHTWDATTGQRILSFQGSHGRVKDLAFADEGLALVYDDGFAEYRDEFARSIPVSRDGQRVVAHEFASGRPAFVFADGSARELGDSFVHDDATQPLRRLIPQASARVALLSDGHVRLWFADKTTTLRTDDPSLRDVAHAGGDKVVTLSEDGTVTLWDVRATRRLTVFSASGAPTRLVVTPSSDETIQVEARGAAWYTYSIARGGPGRDWTSKLEAARPAEPPAADRFLQTGRLEMDGRVVRATRDGGAELIRDKVRRTHVVDGRQQAPVAFSSCGRYLAIVDGIGVGSLRDATTGRPIRSVEGMLAKRDAFSPDGDRLVTEWGTVESTRTGKVVAKLQGAPSPSASSSSLGGRGLGHVSFDGVGKRVVGVSDDADAQVWDASTGERIATLPGSKGAPAIALSADGTMVLACGGRRATIWDATTGAVRAVLRGHDDPVFDCSFSRTGERAVTASLDGMARIWDTRTGAVLRRVEHKIKSLSAARFGPDGKVLVTTTLDGDAALWHVDTGEKVATMVGDGHPLSEPRFSRDGNYLLLAKWSVREARVFDGHRGTLLTTLSDAESKHAADKFPGGYWAADISPEGDRVVTSTIVTNRVLLWDLRVNVSSKERVEAVLASAVPWRVEVAGPGRTTPRDAPAPASSP